MRRFPYSHMNVLMMPTDFCNMNCIYCFNSKKTMHDQHVMSMETLKQVFAITIPFYKELRFIWHGAEPLSVGQDFYENVVKEQFSCVGNAAITNSVQSNLSLLDDEMAKFLVTNEFSIGSSYDGTQNELTRHNSAAILSAYDKLKKVGGKCGFICVVQRKNIDHLITDYEWFKSKNIHYTLNQYLSSTPEKDPLFVPSDYYVSKMCDLFDHWFWDKECNISITFFEMFTDFFISGTKKLCCYNSCMGKHVGIAWDGTITGCNRIFPENYNFGNVFDYKAIFECFESNGFKQMLEKAVKRRKKCRESCSLYSFCEGGCNNVAYIDNDISTPNQYFCETLRGIYYHIEKMIIKLKNSPQKVKETNPYVQRKLEEN